MRGLDPRIHFLKMMDFRVKPAMTHPRHQTLKRDAVVTSTHLNQTTAIFEAAHSSRSLTRC